MCSTKIQMILSRSSLSLSVGFLVLLCVFLTFAFVISHDSHASFSCTQGARAGNKMLKCWEILVCGWKVSAVVGLPHQQTKWRSPGVRHFDQQWVSFVLLWCLGALYYSFSRLFFVAIFYSSFAMWKFGVYNVIYHVLLIFIFSCFAHLKFFCLPCVLSVKLCPDLCFCVAQCSVAWWGVPFLFILSLGVECYRIALFCRGAYLYCFVLSCFMFCQIWTSYVGGFSFCVAWVCRILRSVALKVSYVRFFALFQSVTCFRCKRCSCPMNPCGWSAFVLMVRYWYKELVVTHLYRWFL